MSWNIRIYQCVALISICLFDGLNSQWNSDICPVYCSCTNGVSCSEENTISQIPHFNNSWKTGNVTKLYVFKYLDFI